MKKMVASIGVWPLVAAFKLATRCDNSCSVFAARALPSNTNADTEISRKESKRERGKICAHFHTAGGVIQVLRALTKRFFCGENGVADGDRTRDHRNHNPGLYRLSYSHRSV